ncbi:MAG: hybrid sensor histidine kinase/response regulator [Gammaproteobacteria bacterium]|nr:hybrid sensor histidine kinase/response regulator [Gammaproteobacteria bacterium]
MQHYPASVAELAVRQYAPLCVRVGLDWCVQELWGNPGHYGYAGLQQGGDLRDAELAFHGFEFEPDESEHHWPFLATPSGMSAHCCVQAVDDCYVVTWFEADREHAETQKIQQVANEVRILSYRRNQLMVQLQEAQETLAKQEQELRLANRQQARFISGVSHEFRTPLSSILGYSQRLRREAPLGEPIGGLDVIERNALHLLGLVENLLDHGLLTSGQLQLSPSSVNVQALLADVQQMIGHVAEARGLAFRVVCADNVPAHVWVDEMRLRQVLINLLDNAIKYTKKGAVDLSLAWAGNHIHIEVSDTGPGITAELQERIFVPFSRVGEHDGNGVGLGLSIVRQLVQRMGGRLELKSRLGVGTKFDIHLPAAPVRGEASRVDTRVEQPVVVLAEDDPDLADLLSVYLEDAGLMVLRVESARALLEVAVTSRPHLVLVDKNLSGMGTGFKAIAGLRDEGYQGPVIACSADEPAEAAESALSVGADMFFSKPLDCRATVAACLRLLGVEE